jgi:threonine dehydratase
MTHDVRALAEAADARIRPYLPETPLDHSQVLSEMAGTDVYVKLENLQRTGSFKARGSLNKLLTLDPAARSAGVVAASTGNHGAGVAYAATQLGIPCIVFVPEIASPAKVANMRRLGADVRIFGVEGSDTEIHSRAYAAENGMTYVSPYNDWEVVGGQGTIGVEIARQLPGIGGVVASLGGGGLISGVAGYLKALDPSIVAMAASARNSKAMMESIRQGRIVETEHSDTLSDGTYGGVEPGAITFDLCRRFVDIFVDVDEQEIKAAMRLFIESHHMLLEGSAAVAIAGLLAKKEHFAGRKVAVIICGANIGAQRLKEAL